MDKPKIAFITSSPTIVNSFLKNHIKRLSETYDVFILSNIQGQKENPNFTYSSSNDVYSELQNYAKIRHLELIRRINLIHDLKTIVLLVRLFRKEKFSSIHSITSKVGILVMIAGLIAGTKIRLHTYTGQVWANMNGLKRSFFKLMDKTIAKLATRTYADSNSQLNFLINENVVKESKIEVLGNGSISGVDISRFFPNSNLRKTIRTKYLIPDHEIVFLILCRLTRDKGVIDLAHAFARLVKEISCSLFIVGPDEENLTEEINTIVGEPAKNKLFFHGYTYSHEDFLNAADVLCLPSYREGFGSIIIDAAAVGIPSIGSDIYGISDAIINQQTGLLHTMGDVNGIYTSMKLLATNTELREKLGKSAFDRVRNDFSMETVTSAWISEYSRLIK